MVILGKVLFNLVIVSIVVSLMLLLMSLSRFIFSKKKNLTLIKKDIMFSLVWPFAFLSEEGWKWLKDLAKDLTNRNKRK